MTHSFLIEAGYWNVEGYWLKPSLAIPLNGGMNITWKANWFKLTTSLVGDDESATKIVYQCRGNLNYEEKYYTFVAQHSLFGNIEGEGRFNSQSIVQYYWFIGTANQQKGLDTYYRIDPDTYYLTSSILGGHGIKSTIEATLKRCALGSGGRR